MRSRGSSSSRSGRAVSAGIVSRLRAALEAGGALTYGELASAAGCSTRTVRNYLDEEVEALGSRVVRERGKGGAIRVRLARDDAQATIEDLARQLARQTLRGVFPIAGTSLDRAGKNPRVQAVLAVRGAFQYREPHLRALRAWLAAASRRPRVAVRFEYSSPVSGPGLRVVWPLGLVLRDLARVYVAGVPAEADDGSQVQTYALERIDLVRRRPAVEVLLGEDAGTAPAGIERAVIEDAIDTPFSVYPARGPDSVLVTVRFTPWQATFIEGRRWHRRQTMRRHRDGSLTLRFGPADRGEVEAWVRQWGEGVASVRTERPRARRT